MSIYSRELAEEIIQGLSQGKSLRAVCRECDTAPSTVLGWLEQEDKRDFAEQYAHARAHQYAMLADEILDISDSSSFDVARDKLRVDSRKWMLSKMLPKVYGDKLDLTVKQDTDVRDLSTAELLARIAAAGGAGEEAKPGKPSQVH